MNNLHKSWERLWHGLGTRTDGSHIRDNLISRYSEPHRKYHSLQHLAECITWCEAIWELAHHPAEIEAALWFHDAIYELDRHDNEERSASLAREALSGAGVSLESVYRIEHFVLSTTHTGLPVSLDEQFVVDIDLAIFGATSQRFAEYEKQIREEYALLPAGIFNQKRRDILNSFLNRKRIYGSEYFHSSLETRARSNLLHAIE